MPDQSLHPSVRDFKEFAKKYPKLIEAARKDTSLWQDYYEKWVLLGEEDSYWDSFKEGVNKKERSKAQTDFFQQLARYAENLDVNQVQKQVRSWNETITTLQEMLSTFQSKSGTVERHNDAHELFHFLKD